MILNCLSCKNHLCFHATFYYRVVFTNVSEYALDCSLQEQPSYWEVCSNVSTLGQIAIYHLDEPTLAERFYTTIYL